MDMGSCDRLTFNISTFDKDLELRDNGLPFHFGTFLDGGDSMAQVPQVVLGKLSEAHKAIMSARVELTSANILAQGLPEYIKLVQMCDDLGKISVALQKMQI